MRDGQSSTGREKPLKVDERAELEELRTRCREQDRALSALAGLARDIRHGNMEARVADWDSYGEHAETMAGLNHVLDLTDAFLREAVAALQAAQEKRFYRQVLLNGFPGGFQRAAELINIATASMRDLRDKTKEQQADIASRFDTDMAETIENLSVAVMAIQAYGETLTEQATDSRQRAISVAGAAEQATTNVQTVAAASEELSSSVSEIARQVSLQSDQLTTGASQADDAAAKIDALRQASEAIGEVVAIIKDVADRTNLLALNATIEAARAGDAGRGFAVVASEVKALANQTARATDDIANQVQRIQGETRQSVDAVKKIAALMTGLKDISASIASATEEQASSTQEISRNIQEAAQGTRQVSSDIADVNANAEKTMEQVGGLADLATQMADRADQLKTQSDRFKTSILSMD